MGRRIATAVSGPGSTSIARFPSQTPRSPIDSLRQALRLRLNLTMYNPSEAILLVSSLSLITFAPFLPFKAPLHPFLLAAVLHFLGSRSCYRSLAVRTFSFLFYFYFSENGRWKTENGNDEIGERETGNGVAEGRRVGKVSTKDIKGYRRLQVRLCKEAT